MPVYHFNGGTTLDYGPSSDLFDVDLKAKFVPMRAEQSSKVEKITLGCLYWFVVTYVPCFKKPNADKNYIAVVVLPGGG